MHKCPSLHDVAEMWLCESKNSTWDFLGGKALKALLSTNQELCNQAIEQVYSICPGSSTNDMPDMQQLTCKQCVQKWPA